MTEEDTSSPDLVFCVAQKGPEGCPKERPPSTVHKTNARFVSGRPSGDVTENSGDPPGKQQQGVRLLPVFLTISHFSAGITAQLCSSPIRN